MAALCGRIGRSFVDDLGPSGEAAMKKTTCFLFSTFLCVATHALAQQANVNLDWNPHKNTQNLTPYGANVISP